MYAHKVDVRHSSQVEAWIAATIKQFGQLDGAAKIAGVYDYPTSELWHEQRGIEKWDHVIGVNLTGAANCLHVELEHMASAAASTGRKASIVNMTPVAGLSRQRRQSCVSDLQAKLRSRTTASIDILPASTVILASRKPWPRNMDPWASTSTPLRLVPLIRP